MAKPEPSAICLSAFALCAALLSGCGGSDSSSSGGASATSGGQEAQYEQASADCVAKINAFRATLHLQAYARWSDAEVCADEQATSDGASASAHGAFGKCKELAQNECPGWPGPADAMVSPCLTMMWSEGPGSDFATHGHYINMSSTSYTKVACGFSTLADGSVWATQDFQ